MRSGGDGHTQATDNYSQSVRYLPALVDRGLSGLVSGHRDQPLLGGVGLAIMAFAWP